jgi:hypothetical protein
VDTLFYMASTKRLIYAVIIVSFLMQSALSYSPYDSSRHYCGPEWLPDGVVPRFPAGLDFNHPCYEHDKCYDECHLNCKTQFKCDEEFETGIRAICSSEMPYFEALCYEEHPYIGWLVCPALMINCNSWAMRYRVAVNALGYFSYGCNSEDLEVCRQNRANNLNTGEGYIGTGTTIPPSNQMPPDFFINHTQTYQYHGKLNWAQMTVYVENKGYMGGYAIIQLSDCHTGSILGGKNLLVSGNSIRGESFTLENLPADGCISTQCVQISVSNGSYIRRATEYVKVYSGQINGRVVDVNWNPVPGALVMLSGGEAELTQNDGTYNVTGIRNSGPITITASHPNHGLGQQTINLVIREYGGSSCDGMLASIVDIRLNPSQTSTTQTTHSTTSTLPQTIFEIVCNVGPYSYRLAEPAGNATYRLERGAIIKQYYGNSTAVFVSRADIKPGTYSLEIIKDGFEKITQTITLKGGEHKIIYCGFDLTSTTLKSATTTTLGDAYQRGRRM